METEPSGQHSVLTKKKAGAAKNDEQRRSTLQCREVEPSTQHDTGKTTLMAMMERHPAAAAAKAAAAQTGTTSGNNGDTGRIRSRRQASRRSTERFFMTTTSGSTTFADSPDAASAGTSLEPLRSRLHHQLPARTVTVGERSITLPATSSSQPGSLYHISKRAGDVTCASLAVLFLAVPLVMVALLIWLEDRGPAFYYQTRVGKNGKHFRFYKFRSMVVNADAIKAELAAKNEADGPIFKMKNDPRITRIGRFLRRSSVDELPQLINVLRGEMSLIGPRPQLPREVELYTPLQKNRLLVQPGLLCLREVFGRSTVSFDQWIELDLLYIERRSVQTDFGYCGKYFPRLCGPKARINAPFWFLS